MGMFCLHMYLSTSIPDTHGYDSPGTRLRTLDPIPLKEYYVLLINEVAVHHLNVLFKSI